MTERQNFLEQATENEMKREEIISQYVINVDECRVFLIGPSSTLVSSEDGGSLWWSPWSSPCFSWKLIPELFSIRNTSKQTRVQYKSFDWVTRGDWFPALLYTHTHLYDDEPFLLARLYWQLWMKRGPLSISQKTSLGAAGSLFIWADTTDHSLLWSTLSLINEKKKSLSCIQSLLETSSVLYVLFARQTSLLMSSCETIWWWWLVKKSQSRMKTLGTPLRSAAQFRLFR